MKRISAALSGVVVGAGLTAVATGPAAAAPQRAGDSCHLGNGIRHVVALQFDNVHLRRDNPRVPSDLQQMPQLLHFLTGNGTLLSNDHDVLSHTATNVLSDLTGLYQGFDAMTPDNSLGYVADMQEHGVPVTYAYLSDAHTDHLNGSGDFGPGEPGYVAQLRSYDAAFGTFLGRMRRDGITPRNTLFVVTTDEGDHFVGGVPKPANCDGVTVPCHYATKGEVSVNLPGVLATQQHNRTPFTMHNDPAPAIYVTGQPPRANPAVRRLERDSARLTITNPLTGRREQVAHYLADTVEEKILHFIDADPARTPTFTLFGQPDLYLYAGAPDCSTPCVSEPLGYAWNHGTISPDMTTIWLGMVGPGVIARGVDDRTWADQTDVRPTMLSLLGLHDDYRVDGRVLIEDLDPAVLPGPVRNNYTALLRLGAVYKQLLAGPGQFGMDTLVASTRALESGGPHGDATYTRIETHLGALGARRDQLTERMQRVLLGAEFGRMPPDQGRAGSLTDRGQQLLNEAHRLAAG